MRKIITILILLLASTVSAQDSGTINRLDQWTSTTSPSSAITQRIFGKDIYITGLSDGCLSLSSGILTSAGIACGSGGGGGGDSVFSRTASGLIYAPTTTDAFAIGGTATTSAATEFIFQPVENKFIVTSGKIGIGTTTPYAPLSVVGEIVGAYFTGTTTSTNTFPNASILKLVNLTGNGFVKTSGGDGTLSIDTTTYESGLTAGDGLTRTVNDFDCDTADTNTFGCLTSTDWDTFNDKQAALGFTPANSTLTLTVAGTANQITSSAGAQDLTANRTWTLSLPNHVIFPGNFQVTNSTSTNATTTNLGITGGITFNGVTGSTWASFCETITGSADLCDGSDATGAGGGTADWQQENNAFSVLSLTPTTTIPIHIKSTATSTFAGGLEVWRQISAPYFHATSTSGVSSFNGKLRVLDDIQQLEFARNIWYQDNGAFDTELASMSSGAADTIDLYDNSGSNIAQLNLGTVSGTDVFTFPNKSGTFALTANETFTGLTTMANASSTLFSTTYASSSQWFGGGLTDCDADNQTVSYDITTGQFGCGDDDSTAGSGSGTVSTSTADTAGYVNFFTSNSATPALIGGDSNFFWNNTSKKLGVGSSTPYAQLSLGAPAGGAPYFEIGSTTPLLQVKESTDGRPYVGIGTSSPYATLSVVGGSGIVAGKIHATSTDTSTFDAAPTFSSLTSALILTGAGGLTAEYTGTSCTNQFVRSFNALGVATCASINNGDWSGTDLAVENGGTGASSLTGILLGNGTSAFTGLTTSAGIFGAISDETGGSGVLVGSASPTLTGLTTLANASTTNVTVSGNLYASTSASVLLSATTTMGTGTTTLKLSGFSQPWEFVELGCNSSGSGTFQAQIGDGTASTTLVTSATGLTTAFTTLSSNNAFTRGEAFFIAFGGVSGAVSQPTCSYTRVTK